jgi:hypothetical protein
MKKLITAIALATLIASPAFAKSTHKHHRVQSTRGLYMQTMPKMPNNALGWVHDHAKGPI